MIAKQEIRILSVLSFLIIAWFSSCTVPLMPPGDPGRLTIALPQGLAGSSPASRNLLVPDMVTIRATLTGTSSGYEYSTDLTVTPGTPTATLTLEGLDYGDYGAVVDILDTMSVPGTDIVLWRATGAVTVDSDNVEASLLMERQYGSVAGTVTHNSSGLPGVTVQGFLGNLTTDSSGNFSDTNLPTGAYAVTYTLGGYSFTPSGETVVIQPGEETSLAVTSGISQLSLSFNVGGATGTIPATQAVANGAVVTLPTVGNLQKSGLDFAGWSPMSGADAVYPPGANYTVNNNVVMYAVWVGTMSENTTSLPVVQTVPGETHCYAINVSAAGTLTVETTAQVIDPYGILYDSSWTILAANDDTTGLNFSVSSTVTPGTYYILVRPLVMPGPGDGTGYTLKSTRVP